jgi:hypothetical protein
MRCRSCGVAGRIGVNTGEVLAGTEERLAFSAVETGGDEQYITVGQTNYPFAGYVSPPT